MTIFRPSAGLSDSMAASVLPPPDASFAIEGDGDTVLKDLLLTGSLLSIWHRMQFLWSNVDSGMGGGTAVSSDDDYDGGGRAGSVSKGIYWAVYNAVLEMTRWGAVPVCVCRLACRSV